MGIGASKYLAPDHAGQDYVGGVPQRVDILRRVAINNDDIGFLIRLQGARNGIDAQRLCGIAGNGTGSESTLRKEGQLGTQSLLDGVLSCIRQRCRILGLELPASVVQQNLPARLGRPTGTSCDTEYLR